MTGCKQTRTVHGIDPARGVIQSHIDVIQTCSMIANSDAQSGYSTLHRLQRFRDHVQLLAH
jgi:hypothetical protein